ncbi:hypothetical protein [Brachybacterium nesterenkovii]|uniref:hypothetical protein n=1 Tax=Brachybacterium nesterenkovii TaxID=47847 RepID=UPI003219B038
MSTDPPYVMPEERDFIDSWACRHVEYDIPADERADVARALLARVRRDAAREALDGLADRESRLMSESNLFQDKANHLFASQAAGRYRYDNYPEETR